MVVYANMEKVVCMVRILPKAAARKQCSTAQAWGGQNHTYNINACSRWINVLTLLPYYVVTYNITLLLYYVVTYNINACSRWIYVLTLLLAEKFHTQIIYSEYLRFRPILHKQRLGSHTIGARRHV